MKELLLFPLELAGFVVALAALHFALGYFNVSGLGAFLLYSLPIIAFIAFATGGKPKGMAKSFGTIASGFIRFCSPAWALRCGRNCLRTIKRWVLCILRGLLLNPARRKQAAPSK